MEHFEDIYSFVFNLFHFLGVQNGERDNCSIFKVGGKKLDNELM